MGKEEVLQVEKKHAVALLKAIGVKGAKDMSNKKLSKTLLDLDDLPDEKLEDKYLDELLDSILEAKDIEIIEKEEKSESKSEEKEEKKSSKPEEDEFEDDDEDKEDSSEDDDDDDSEDEEKSEEKEEKKSSKKDKKEKKEKKEKKAKKEKSTKVNRIAASFKALSSLSKKGLSRDEAIEACDKAYVETGGDTNIKEAGYTFNRTAQVMELAGLIKIEDDGTVKPVGKDEE